MVQIETSQVSNGFPQVSFEFFPPKSEEAETQLWETIDVLSAYMPEFVSVTYGAGGTTKAPTLSTVARIARETRLNVASHLTCVGSTRDDVAALVREFQAAGIRHFVALRGDPSGGVGSAYVPTEGGFSNAAELTAGLRELGDFEISVSAYPEKHPESRDVGADIDMLKRKVDNGATRALTQFFFDNDVFETYLNRVRAAGVTIPVVPGILPIHNLSQVRKFAGMCGATVPEWIIEKLTPLDDNLEARSEMAAVLAAEQMIDLNKRGIEHFHVYTMNRSPLVSRSLDLCGFFPKINMTMAAE